MMTAYDTQTATQNQTLDDICFTHYGTTTGVVEQVLNFNPGLADHGPHLPLGLIIKLPVITQAATPSAVNLWE